MTEAEKERGAVEDDGPSKIQAAARTIAEAEWTARHPAMRYEALHSDAREILEASALKGVCVGIVMGGVTWDQPDHLNSEGREG